MNGSRDAQASSVDDGGPPLQLIALGTGAIDVPVFAYVSLTLFDDPVFGAFVGLVVGLGMYLLLPEIMADDGAADDEATPTDVGTRLRGFHRTAAGLALPPAGIMLFGWRFVSDSVLVGTLVATLIAAVIYVSLAVLLPQRLA
ncbi:hypothetical protein [Natrinema sp. 1APR25-10V2]|uniref:hypothetical protein n=1 Tax=Natrinema sp. 1APR25-10V2 TaxID=2951081 RepID=UPI0028763F00|nr:hypothetical protein [Natrinema sp. 1APR25-10V2]MDS0475889.1 hypothetical protein [Natrinema sp. 1APR25-10V2]